MKTQRDYKDKEKYVEYRNRYKRKYRNNTGAFQYPSRGWTNEELDLVLKHEIPDRELSVILKRSVGAIQNARSRFGGGIKECKGKW